MNRIELLQEKVQPYYQNNDPGHDWLHVQRVVKNALKIAEGLEVRKELLLAGVLCHDLVNIAKDHPDRSKASEMSADEAVSLLRHVGFDEKSIQTIRDIIIEHSFSKGLKPSTLEAAILQDADRLDAIGAIGILRCATTSGKMGSKLYHPTESIAQSRPLDDTQYMLDHYYKKLYLLAEKMNTDTARKLAEKRIDFMKIFENQMISEL